MSTAEETPMVEIRAAAKWWADKLRRMPSFDNGDSSFHGQLASVLALQVAASKPAIGEGSITAFEKALVDVLGKDERWRWGIGVDYHPDDALSAAADIAAIDVDGKLPWKTNMRIERGKVMVGEGHGAPWRPLELEAEQR